MRSFVAIHLDTTGADDATGEPFALAAVRFENGEEADRLDLRVRSADPPPARTLEAAGVTREELRAAAPLSDALREFRDFLGRAPVVTSQIDGARDLLAPRRSRSTPTLLDLALLARIVFPSLDAHNLLALARRLELADAPPASPLERAELAGRVWLKLIENTEHISWAVLTQIVRLLEPTAHPLLEVFADAEKRAMSRAFNEGAKFYGDLAQDFSDELRRKPASEDPTPPKPIDARRIADIFREGGLIQSAHPTYEQRPEQVRMAEAVCEAFNNNEILLIEAGTGVGKSLAYLTPAIAWARRNEEKVIVSTNTRNLQHQLCDKDIPLLTQALDVKFDWALIKGRGNYLCVRKFLHLLREADRELSPAERVEVLPLVVWFPETVSGDVADCPGFTGDWNPELWSRLSTRGDECAGPECRQAKRCFVRVARARANQADLIVANHAVVFSEIGIDSQVLPPHSRIIFDEAHNVENVATENLAQRVEPRRVRRVLRRLFAARRDGAGRGLLTSLRFQLHRSREKVGAAQADTLDANIDPCIAEMDELTAGVDAFATAVGGLFAGSRESRMRYTRERFPPGWESVAAAADALQKRLKPLHDRLKSLAAGARTFGAGLPESDSLASDLDAAASALGEFSGDLHACRVAENPNFVYWAEHDESRRGQHALCAAPLDITELMQAGVYSQNRTVVLSSATLTVEGGFDFMRRRLGLAEDPDGRVRTLDVGSSFDFRRQSMLGVMSFLPEPNDYDFGRAFAEAAVGALRATRGRSLVLFTSHRMLREAYPIMKDALEPEGIRVLAQGIDGERSRLARRFQEDVSSVLLGAASFWEGVDVTGEALSCLILARLPFQVYTDPIVAARSERIEADGGNAFYDYSVPSAVIRLKQGFGRLIRSHSDRGVVLIADRRIVAKSYGRVFLRSLPTTARDFRRLDALADQVEQFLNAEADWTPPLRED